MNDFELTRTLNSCGGIAHIQDLLSAGFTRYQIAAMHRSGKLLRPRIGWYVSPDHEDSVVRAVRAGGVLDCISAARSYGLATPPDDRVHVGLASNAARLRSTQNGYRRVAAGEDSGIVRHWGTVQPGVRFRVGLFDCLQTVLTCVPAEWAVGVIDSALRTTTGPPRLSPSEFDRLAFVAGKDKRRVLDRCSGKAESILESVTRVRLGDAGLEPEEQVAIGRYRADFVIDAWLIIECDGGAHSEKERFASDRARDAEFARLGFRVLRFTYAQIMRDWDSTLQAIRAVLALGPSSRIR
jgi:very-short-patch-repair endonuclease